MEIKELKVEQLPKDGIIRVFTAKGVDEKEQKKLDNISGAIQTPLEFLEKRKDTGNIEMKNSHVEYDFEKFKIVLIVNENSHYSNQITGKMIETETLKNLSINTGKRWSAFELADYIRLNRTIFRDMAEAAKLVTLLNNFKAKVDKEMEQQKDNRANYNLQKRQVVESNLPDAFTLVLPIFKGQPKVEIEVEVDIDANSLECVLISPQLAEIKQTSIETIIDEQLSKIKELCPELPVIEV